MFCLRFCEFVYAVWTRDEMIVDARGMVFKK